MPDGAGNGVQERDMMGPRPASSSAQGALRVMPLAMLRLPTLTLADYRALFTPPDIEDDQLVRTVWAEPRLREAVWATNPVVAEAVERLLTGDLASPRRVRRLAAALSNYTIRITARPTPFGLFSGVGFVGWGGGALEQISLRTVSHLGSGVLHRFARQGESDPRVLREVTLAHNPTLRGGVARVEAIAGGTGDVGERVSVRRTSVLDLVLDLTRIPIRGGELIACLRQRHSVVPDETLERYVRDLVASGVLITSLRPPSRSRYPVAALERLVTRDSVPSLEHIGALIEEYDRNTVGSGVPILQRIRAGLAEGGTSAGRGDVAIDLALSFRGTLPEALQEPVVRATRILLSIARAVPGSAALAHYAQAFAARFAQEEVPVLDLLDPVRGLGAPAGYPGSHWGSNTSAAEPGPAWLSCLRRRLLQRAAQAADGVAEILNEDLDLLPAPVRWPVPSCDVFVLLPYSMAKATSQSVIGPGGFLFPAGRAFSRFGHLDERVADHIRQALATELAANPDVCFADVEYRYPDPAVGELTIGISPYPTTIVTTAAPPLSGGPPHLTLGDIVVGVANGRLYLRSMLDGRQVIARSHHALSLREAPNAIRFLREVSDDLFAVPGWTWGAFADTHERLPRLRIGDVTVAPARWRAPEPELSGTDPQMQLTLWRHRRGVPRYVHAGRLDNRLLLDLEVAAHRRELLTQTSRGLPFVEEVPPGMSPGSRPDRVAEAVISLVDADPPVLPVLPTRVAAYAGGEATRLRLPGDQWWSFHLYGHRNHQDNALRSLRSSLADLGAPEWFFVRYNIPHHHLRLRVRVGAVSCDDLCGLARDLHRQEFVGRFVIEPYEQEAQRFGGFQLLADCQRLFCRETPAVIDALAEIALQRLRAASSPAPSLDLVGVGCLFASSYLLALGVPDPVAERVLELMANMPVDPAPHIPRVRRTRAHEHAQRALLVGLLTGRPWPSHYAGLMAGVTQIRESVSNDGWLRGPNGESRRATWLRSLLHLHLNRLGLSPAIERQIGIRLRGTRHSRAFRSGS